MTRCNERVKAAFRFIMSTAARALICGILEDWKGSKDIIGRHMCQPK
jgi:hypothetical protein